MNKYGYTLIANWRLKDFELSIHTKELFSLLDIKCVFDVGANKGQYRDFLRNDIGYKGLILSFEPVHHLSEILEERAKKDPNWKVFNKALGSQNEIVSINISKGNTLHSFLEPIQSQPDSKWFEEHNRVIRKEEVIVQTLDSFLKEFNLDTSLNHAFLKMDTQGFDLEVLKGAEESLSKIAALQTEISVLPIYQKMPDYFHTINTLNLHAFYITGLFPVCRDSWLRVIEFDCLAINYSLCKQISEPDTTMIASQPT
ncbi:MAG: FkbM family methyltransferase [Leptospirales bacterium]